MMSHHHADVPAASPAVQRRNLLIGATASLLCASTRVRASSLMSLKTIDWTPLAPLANGRHHAGWTDRLAYKMMDDVLKSGWTPERVSPFYGGISESKMRSIVAFARRHGFLR
jgi:hypothetical protein